MRGSPDVSLACAQQVRHELGRQLAREWPTPQVQDGEMLPVIIPIPESATHATLGFHEESLKMGTPSVLRHLSSMYLFACAVFDEKT